MLLYENQDFYDRNLCNIVYDVYVGMCGNAGYEAGKNFLELESKAVSR